MERNFEKTDFEYVSKWMLENGYSFDFFSDRQLEKFTNSGSKVRTSGNSYQAILLPANKLIPEKTMQHLIDLANNGATIIFYKNLPAYVPGFDRSEERKKELNRMISAISFRHLDNGMNISDTKGGGSIIGSNNIDQLFGAVGIRQERLLERGLQFTRRINGDTAYYFIVNRREQKFDGWDEIDGRYTTVLLFDPMNKKTGRAKFIPEDNVKTNIRLQLEPGESIIIKAFNSAMKAPSFPYTETIEKSIEIKGKWEIEFLDGGPLLPAKVTIDKLISWTELDGEDVKNFSGTAKYSILFDKPAGNATSWLLELGKVNETAEVILNGKKITTLIGPTFQCVIPASAFQQNNKLEIIVANLMANRISYMDRNNIPWKIFYNTNMPARRRENAKNGLFDASGWKPLPSGLLGPVILTPAK
jgi:hypothetical protein